MKAVVAFLVSWLASASVAAQDATSRAASAPASREITYFIAEGIPQFGSLHGDQELVAWAFEEWERAASGAFSFVRSGDEGTARVRIYWNAWSGRGINGSHTRVPSSGQLASTIFIRPDTPRMHPKLGPI